MTAIDKVLLFTDEHMFIFDVESLAALQEVEVQSIHAPVEFIRCCDATGSGSIILACKVYVEFADEFCEQNPTKVYEAQKRRGNTLVMECSFNLST